MTLLPLNDKADCRALQHENRVSFSSITAIAGRSPLQGMKTGRPLCLPSFVPIIDGGPGFVLKCADRHQRVNLCPRNS